MTPSLQQVVESITKALESGPTPGEWECQDESKFSPDEPYWIGAQHPLCGFVSHAVVRSGCDEADELGDMKANAAYIAAANPDAIRTLLTAHEEAQAVIAGLREDAERYRAIREFGSKMKLYVYEDPADMLSGDWLYKPRPEDVDAEVDAARAALQANKEQP